MQSSLGPFVGVRVGIELSSNVLVGSLVNLVDIFSEWYSLDGQTIVDKSFDSEVLMS